MRLKHISGWEATVVELKGKTVVIKGDSPGVDGEYVINVFSVIDDNGGPVERLAKE